MTEAWGRGFCLVRSGPQAAQIENTSYTGFRVNTIFLFFALPYSKNGLKNVENT